MLNPKTWVQPAAMHLGSMATPTCSQTHVQLSKAPDGNHTLSRPPLLPHVPLTRAKDAAQTLHWVADVQTLQLAGQLVHLLPVEALRSTNVPAGHGETASCEVGGAWVSSPAQGLT